MQSLVNSIHSPWSQDCSLVYISRRFFFVFHSKSPNLFLYVQRTGFTIKAESSTPSGNKRDNPRFLVRYVLTFLFLCSVSKFVFFCNFSIFGMVLRYCLCLTSLNNPLLSVASDLFCFMQRAHYCSYSLFCLNIQELKVSINVMWYVSSIRWHSWYDIMRIRRNLPFES